jgi:hypothetical protein
VFRSTAAQWLLARLVQPDPRRPLIAKLQWELEFGVELTPQIQQQQETARRQNMPLEEWRKRLKELPQLSAEELDTRKMGLDILKQPDSARKRALTVVKVALTALFRCPFCNHAWAALAVVLCCALTTHWADLLATTAAYATLTTALGSRMFEGAHKGNETPKSGGCGGKH